MAEESSKEEGKKEEKKFRYEKEKTLFEWEAPERPFKERDREFWVSLAAIAGVVGFILLIVEGIMPVILEISILFLFYILSTVKPHKIKYAITDWGVKMGDNTTDMDLLLRFWFGKRFGSNMLIFETIRFPGRLELVINEKDKKKISEVLEEYLPEEEVPPSRIERSATWLSQKMPGNK